MAQEAQKQGLDQAGDTRFAADASRGCRSSSRPALSITCRTRSRPTPSCRPNTSSRSTRCRRRSTTRGTSWSRIRRKRSRSSTSSRRAESSMTWPRRNRSIRAPRTRVAISAGSRRANMVKPFADAVTALKKGEYTQQPVQTQYGWHVIQLLETRETPVPPFDQVKDRVSQLVQQKKFRAYQDDLLKTAKVEKSVDATAATPAAASAAPASPRNFTRCGSSAWGSGFAEPLREGLQARFTPTGHGSGDTRRGGDGVSAERVDRVDRVERYRCGVARKRPRIRSSSANYRRASSCRSPSSSSTGTPSFLRTRELRAGIIRPRPHNRYASIPSPRPLARRARAAARSLHHASSFPMFQSKPPSCPVAVVRKLAADAGCSRSAQGIANAAA